MQRERAFVSLCGAVASCALAGAAAVELSRRIHVDLPLDDLSDLPGAAGIYAARQQHPESSTADASDARSPTGYSVQPPSLNAAGH